MICVRSMSISLVGSISQPSGALPSLYRGSCSPVPSFPISGHIVCLPFCKDFPPESSSLCFHNVAIVHDAIILSYLMVSSLCTCALGSQWNVLLWLVFLSIYGGRDRDPVLLPFMFYARMPQFTSYGNDFRRTVADGALTVEHGC